ncbi:hypothetical protein [Rhizobium leguminosarum]|uniref:hypothetical protein n=1 Tax=Rhizobium leguminosarum TaxID=384 RepID=UPI001AE56603|nr:hypothetical protein [Rhizobium leguminosarum]MBP2446991.1 hypothetical protein [Rhizobium leguminosarum]
MQLFRNLHDALERHLPTIVDEAARQEALRYLRGLKSVLATTVDTSTSSNVIQFEDRLIRRRIERSIAQSHRRQLSDARRVHMRAVDEFGWDIWDDID